MFCRWADREPNKNSRVCGCHFPNGKEKGPCLFQWSKTTPSQPTNTYSQSPDHADHTYCKVAGSETAVEPNPGPNGGGMKEQEDVVFQDSRPVSGNTMVYPPTGLTDDVIRMETGLPDNAMFRRVVGLVQCFEGSMIYAAGWRVEGMAMESQVFMALMKVWQNYTHLHLAQLFSCSTATVANVVKTFIHLLHNLLFKTMMAAVPSRIKNRESMPASFLPSASNCRIIIDCIDIQVAAPKEMDKAKMVYLAYRGMHSFKVLIGVAFFNHGKFTESEVRATKEVARNRIHVERANAHIKDFRILIMIPSLLRSSANALVQLCGTLVNLQQSLN